MSYHDSRQGFPFANASVHEEDDDDDYEEQDHPTQHGHHPYKHPKTCSLCQKNFPSSSKLGRHMRSHTGEKPFTCPRCSANFSQKSSLKTHMIKHDTQTLICPSCHMMGLNKDLLCAHEKFHASVARAAAHQLEQYCPTAARGSFLPRAPSQPFNTASEPIPFFPTNMPLQSLLALLPQSWGQSPFLAPQPVVSPMPSMPTSYASQLPPFASQPPSLMWSPQSRPITPALQPRSATPSPIPTGPRTYYCGKCNIPYASSASPSAPCPRCNKMN